jgi:hypothetical protein
MRRWVAGIATFLSVLVAAAASSWVILSYQVAERFPVPEGVDTPSHLWRTRTAYAVGLRGLFGSSPYEFHANSANPDRIGLPVLGSLLGSVANVGPWRLMFVVSALAAAVIAFSAWALARAAGEPEWAAPLYALVVAVSMPIAITSRSHLDNVLVDALMVAGAALVIRVAGEEPGVVAAVLLGVAGVLMHWPIGLLFITIVAWFACLLIPLSVRARRDGTAWTATPSARVGAVAVGAGLLGAVALVWTPGAHVFSTAQRGAFADNVRRLLHHYRLPLTLPLAGLGAVLLWFQSPHAPRRRALLFYIAWLTPVAAGALAFAAGRSLPVMRLVGVALPLPFLAAALGVGLIRLASSPRGILGGVLAALVAVAVLIAIGGEALVARRSFEGTQPMVTDLELEPTRAAISYLTTAAPDRQAVFVVHRTKDEGTDFGMIPAFRRIRALAPGWYAPNIATYLGDPLDLLRGRPTHLPGDATFDEASDLYWPALQRWLKDDAVVLVLEPFHAGFERLREADPGAEIAPGVLLVRGPPPAPGWAPPAPLTAPTTGSLVSWTAWSFLVLAAAGLGWAWGLLRLPWLDRLALAPAIGLAVLIAGGFGVGMQRVTLHGGAGRWTAVGVAAAGWVVGGGRWAWERWRRKDPEPLP